MNHKFTFRFGCFCVGCLWKNFFTDQIYLVNSKRVHKIMRKKKLQIQLFCTDERFEKKKNMKVFIKAKENTILIIIQKPFTKVMIELNAKTKITHIFLQSVSDVSIFSINSNNNNNPFEFAYKL